MPVERDIQVAWAAGILEGEGSFLVKTGSPYLRVQVHMTDLDVLQSLQKIFGGNIHPISKREEHWKDAWAWALNGSNAYTCMAEIRPYMHSRRAEKIDVCLEARQEYEQNLIVKKKALTELEERVAKEYLAGGVTIRELAKKYGIGRQSTFRYIKKYRENLS